jgi:hypothetical protein
MTRHALLGLTAFVLSGAVALGQQGSSEDQPAKGDFAGKIVQVQTRSGTTTTLEQVHVRKLGGQAFLVGRVVKDTAPAQEAAGIRTWLAVSEVVRLTEFADLDQLKKLTQTGKFKVGQNVEVEWQGTWWAAEVVKVKDGSYYIHYTGWDNSWDEWVGDNRIRVPQQGQQGGKFGVGSKVEVEWQGQWWAAEVVQTKDGRYFIHYTGWDNSWDEWVGNDRIRAMTKGQEIERPARR